MSFAVSPRRVLVALVIAGASVALVASLGGTAKAGKVVCPAKTLCVFEHDGYIGQVVKIKTDGISNKLAKKLNNGASSVINNRNKRSYLYDRKNAKGEKVCISPKSSVGSLGEFNDKASSSRNTKNKKVCPVIKD